MDEVEFRRLLDLFPIVRSRDYHVELEASRESTSRSSQSEVIKEWQDAWDEGNRVENQGISQHDAFWGKLKLAVERKVGAADAERFCKAFQQIHKKLVHEELSFDAAQSFINSTKSSEE
ncbi:hypothetical protein I3843_14G111300 [Carya illinoinensis]|uniref:Uncharacterized protein n=1 Tax=Carya illinoinensis TaxID=32201 RepID=A0A8T1NDC8_CARIL|nr:uncharacterized protein LOC122294940 isoform X1 [Carya illinoinensis]KAG6629806.1 hypothetical protein CIPAW_14G110600 [Carya illinoinensis]KAG7947778.1 hypothetical protein I3843_14G111300 [Carya illinoinensis]